MNNIEKYSNGSQLKTVLPYSFSKIISVACNLNYVHAQQRFFAMML